MVTHGISEISIKKDKQDMEMWKKDRQIRHSRQGAFEQGHTCRRLLCSLKQ